MKKHSKLMALLLSFMFAFSLAGCVVPTESGNGSSSGLLPSEVVIAPGGESIVTKPVTSTNRHLTAKVEKAGRVTLEKNSECPADFVLNVEGEEEIKILQITDTQMIDPTQVRLGNGAVSDRYLDRDYVMYDILRYVINATKPDLILVTGDYVYGDYDDNGSCFREQTQFFDSMGIYWAPIYGNHDNDSDSEYARWLEEGWEDWYGRSQCQYFEQAKYCLFRTRAEISGYSNYSIAIKQNGEFIRSIFMLDTHGAHSTTQGIYDQQVKWFKETNGEINAYAGKTLPNFTAIHVPLYAFNLALQQKYGYVEGTTPNIEIPANADGDWGFALTNPGGHDKNLAVFNALKNNGTDAILAGHQHTNNYSILYEGVRLVFGTKSSRYDQYSEDLLGATLFTVNGGNFTVSPVYYVDGATA